MTKRQYNRIITLRKQGYKLDAIAEQLHLSFREVNNAVLHAQKGIRMEPLTPEPRKKTFTERYKQKVRRNEAAQKLLDQGYDRDVVLANFPESGV